MVICLERGADLHMAQLMPLPLTVSCFSKIQIGFTFLVPAHPGSPGQRAVKRACVCVQSVVMALFRERHSFDEEQTAWELWHMRQHSFKQRVIDVGRSRQLL